ncbi:MAG: T9SS type A sorting domain-containing protein [Bacteroidales bacterium]|nr:T9SS type A sorting domain-containing protein [Bacteroidales bacterium]
MILVTVTEVSCPGNNDGSIMVEINGSGQFNICITAGCEMDDDTPSQVLKAQTATYINLSPGNYLISITDANGCSWYDCFEVGEPEPVNYTFDYEPIYCFGHTTEVTVEGTGGTPPYVLVDHNGSELAWFDHETTVTGVTAGMHSWYLYDSMGCTPAQIEFTLTEPVPVIATLLSLEHGLCFGHESGRAEFSVSGGASPYFFNMGHYQDGILTIENLPAGNHNLIVTDSKNCGPGEVTFEIEEPEEIIITTTEVSPSLAGGNNGQIILDITGGIQPYYVSLNNGCEPDDTAETFIFYEGQEIRFNGLNPGWKIITVSDQNGCLSSECIEINTQHFERKPSEILNVTDEFNPGSKPDVKIYPNPFRNNANIEFTLQESCYAVLEVFNISGLRVAALFEGRVGAYESQKFNLSSELLPDGIYIIKLTTENKSVTKRIIVSR